LPNVTPPSPSAFAERSPSHFLATASFGFNTWQFVPAGSIELRTLVPPVLPEIHLAKGVVDGHHHLLPDRIPCRRLRAEQPLATARLAADAAAGQAQDSQSDKDSR